MRENYAANVALPVVLVLDHVYQSLADRQPEEEPRQLPRPPVCLTVIPPGLCTRVSLSLSLPRVISRKNREQKCCYSNERVSRYSFTSCSDSELVVLQSNGGVLGRNIVGDFFLDICSPRYIFEQSSHSVSWKTGGRHDSEGIKDESMNRGLFESRESGRDRVERDRSLAQVGRRNAIESRQVCTRLVG